MRGIIFTHRVYWLGRLLSITVLVSLSLSACRVLPAETTPSPPDMCGMNFFEDLTPGTQYPVNTIFSSQAQKFKVNEYVTASGTPIATEYANVEEHYGDMGVFIKNIDLEFQLVNPVTDMRIYIGDYSSEAKITINGEAVYFSQPPDIDGTVIGGVPVSVIDLGDSSWQINLKDVVSSFSLGGPEVWLGDICFGEEAALPPDGETPSIGKCVDFESLSAGTKYLVGDTFSEAGIKFTVSQFTMSGGVPYTSGEAEIETMQAAGGSGNELWTRNVNIAMDFGTDISGLTMLFGAHGGDLNIEINGDFVYFDDPATISSTIIGGVHVNTIPSSGVGLWSLELAGTISTIAIGGAEFAMDDVCPLLK